jgi:hypothetical protein
LQPGVDRLRETASDVTYQFRKRRSEILLFE